MDRRQRKTRRAIFEALIALLEQKDFEHITVEQILEKADVGRATFYTHFETKEYLLKELCEDLFCHLFDAVDAQDSHHHHIFCCDAPDAVFLHLFEHLKNNDNQLMTLLCGRNNEVFLRYFQNGLRRVVYSQLPLFAERKDTRLPEELWVRHICACFVETVRWWVENKVQASPKEVCLCFYLLV